MSRSLRLPLVACALARGASAETVTIADLDQGAEFSQCILTEDFTSKGPSEAVTVVDRGSDGCCPADHIPGMEKYANYVGAMVICGWADDGTWAGVSTTTGTTSSCTYGKCYVMQQDFTCADDTKMTLNGCCGDSSDQNLPEDCMGYVYTADIYPGDDVQYCLTYHATYQMENTADVDDDITDGKLDMEKIYVYTACDGSGLPGAAAPAPAPAADDASRLAPIGLLAGFLGLLVA